VASQADIDALLAEAESLANEADADVQANGGASGPKDADSHPGSASVGMPAHQLPADLQRALKIRVPVIVRLANRAIPISQITTWVPGSIIEFEKGADEPLDIMTNNTCIGYGTAVKVGENFGIRITSVIDARGKLEAMAAH
jgi:flagellar motor switch protein FliN/FliY